MSGKDANGGLGHTPAALLSDAGVAGAIRRSTFADELPYFRAGDARFDGHERLFTLLQAESDLTRTAMR